MVDYRDYREYVKWDVLLTQNELVTDESVLMDSRTINSETYGHYSFTIANNLHANNRIAVPRTYYVGYQVDVYIDDVYASYDYPNTASGYWIGTICIG